MASEQTVKVGKGAAIGAVLLMIGAGVGRITAGGQTVYDPDHLDAGSGSLVYQPGDGSAPAAWVAKGNRTAFKKAGSQLVVVEMPYGHAMWQGAADAGAPF